MTLGTVYLTCTVTFMSYNQPLRKEVSVTAENTRCRVIDDRYMDVGTPENKSTPVLVDCWEEIAWLNPVNTDGVMLVLKGEECE